MTQLFVQIYGNEITHFNFKQIIQPLNNKQTRITIMPETRFGSDIPNTIHVIQKLLWHQCYYIVDRNIYMKILYDNWMDIDYKLLPLDFIMNC